MFLLRDLPKSSLSLYPFKERNLQIKGEHRDPVGKQRHGISFLSLGRSSDIQFFSMSFYFSSFFTPTTFIILSGSPSHQFFLQRSSYTQGRHRATNKTKITNMDTINASTDTSKTVSYGSSDLIITEKNAAQLSLQEQEKKGEGCVRINDSIDNTC